MKHLTFSNLSDIGINPLTGEACAYSQRTLCDLNEDGCVLLADWLGLKYDSSKLHSDASAFAENWNTTVGHKPAVASVMLDRTVFPALMRFALLRKGYQYVLGAENCTNYSAFNDSDLNQYPGLQHYLDGTNCDQGNLLYRNPRRTQPGVGSRNEHAFTGRVI